MLPGAANAPAQPAAMDRTEQADMATKRAQLLLQLFTRLRARLEDDAAAVDLHVGTNNQAAPALGADDAQQVSFDAMLHDVTAAFNAIQQELAEDEEQQPQNRQQQ
jgi:hypothetical protein